MGPAGDGHHEHGLNLSLWVKGELFTFGTVAGTPHPRLGFSNIRKMVTYCKNKGMKYAVYNFSNYLSAVFTELIFKPKSLLLKVPKVFHLFNIPYGST